MRNRAGRRDSVGLDESARPGVPSVSAAAAKHAPSCDSAWLDRLHPPVYAFVPVETRIFAALSSQDALPKITTLSAPPGYGKTVLLSQLYRAFTGRGIPCVWIGLDERSSRFGSLLSLIEAALGVKRADRPAIDALRLADPIDRIDTILRAVANVVRTCILFIDNINFCREAGVERLLDALVFRTGTRVKLIVSSAAGPVPFNAARARLELDLHMVTAADLSFDRKATSELFLRAGIASIDPATLEAVVRKTEGWPAAVRLLQLIARDENSLERGVEVLSGDEAHLADMLSRRLMSSFEPDLVTFLHEVAALRHFSAELAQAATGRARAAEWISFLVDRNVMIVPLDRRRRWYRFHALFRQFLVSEAARSLTPARRGEVHRDAARWLTRRGDHQGALELAIDACERQLAAELLERIACVLVREQGDTSSFLDWVSRAEAIGVPKGPEATFWYVWALLYERHYEAARAELARAAEQLDGLPDTAFAQDLRRKLGVATIVIAVHLDAPDRVREEADGWLRSYSGVGEPFETAAAAGALAASCLSGHAYVAGRRDLAISQAAIARADSEYGRCWVEMVSGMIEIGQGHPALAEGRLHEIEMRARAAIGPGASVAAVVALVRARALYDCGRLDEAIEIVANNLRRASVNGIPDTTWLGIEVALASALHDDARFTVAELRALVREHPKRLALLFELSLVQQLLVAERPQEALDHARDLGWSARSGWDGALTRNATVMERTAAQMAAIALAIAVGHLAIAGRLIKQELRSAQAAGRKGAQVDLHLLDAEAQLRANAGAAATRAFSRAVAAAAPHTLYGPFVRRRDLVKRLIESGNARELGLTSRTDMAALADISRLVGVAPMVRRPQHPRESMFDPPTPRELELLALLENGLDNRQLAERLAISLPTIKWHLSNLYCKLGVKNRASAIAKGRALRLLHR
ncbi:LuxR family maltose regulon positive regulatory protein [Bradyrhizobium macuxiense]|uniref:LuxR family maltose regulon positive regulatory protein n=1 Tax=Bradyrhizobium macuxiense TaxID=1755647 RepID=A0A560LDB0_9BRAD|nr:LuxR C-terminal-related transcriptional regulator [Bradyrhizobium macuxiense]TWB93189.1 LuxR family maltose regulon positive regulatory protein [Bradyrhizobium macuxiense]